MRHLQLGDEDAFELLVQQYHAAMLRVAAGIVHEMTTAEDVVQDAWLAVLKAIHNFEGRSSLKTWLFSIVINRARTYLRREQRHSYRSKISLDAVEPPLSEFVISSTDEQPESIATIHEIKRTVSQTIKQLPSKQQHVVRWRYLDGFSSSEVTQEFGLSEVNQRVLLHRARKQLRVQLVSY